MTDNLSDRIRREQSDSQLRAIRRLHEADHIHLTDNHFAISDAARHRANAHFTHGFKLGAIILFTGALIYALVVGIFLL